MIQDCHVYIENCHICPKGSQCYFLCLPEWCLHHRQGMTQLPRASLLRNPMRCLSRIWVNGALHGNVGIWILMVILAALGLEALTGIYALACGAPHLLKKKCLWEVLPLGAPWRTHYSDIESRGKWVTQDVVGGRAWQPSLPVDGHWSRATWTNDVPITLLTGSRPCLKKSLFNSTSALKSKSDRPWSPALILNLWVMTTLEVK